MPLHGLSLPPKVNTRRLAGITVALLICLVGSLARVAAAPESQSGNPGETVFQQKCAACHTIGGGKLIGPDLKGVTERRDAIWLRQFIADPAKVLASGDPTASQLLKEYNNVPMPNLGLTPQEIEGLIAYLAAQNSATTPAVGAIPLQPVAPGNGDVPQGRSIFIGQMRLSQAGMPCIACHSVEGIGLLGGGGLGPDLTHVYTRYGQSGLAAALSSLPFPTMQGIYANRPLAPAEQADLLAFFAAVDQQGAPRSLPSLLMILAGGVSLTGVLFLGMTFFWPRQRLSVSQRLRRLGGL